MAKKTRKKQYGTQGSGLESVGSTPVDTDAKGMVGLPMQIAGQITPAEKEKNQIPLTIEQTPSQVPAALLTKAQVGGPYPNHVTPPANTPIPSTPPNVSGKRNVLSKHQKK